MSDLIKISKEFRGISGGLWLGMETTVHVESDQEFIEEYKKKNDLLEKVFMALNPSINWERGSVISVNPEYAHLLNETPPPIDQRTPKEKQIDSHISTINLCETSEALERFRPMVEREKIPSLSEAFNNKLKSFGQ